jgi:hypothetical protein
MKLQALWDKYGKANFEFSVLEYTTRAEYKDREKDYIKKLNPTLNTMLSPNATPYNRVKAPPEIKKELLYWSGYLGINTDELVEDL